LFYFIPKKQYNKGVVAFFPLFFVFIAGPASKSGSSITLPRELLLDALPFFSYRVREALRKAIQLYFQISESYGTWNAKIAARTKLQHAQA